MRFTFAASVYAAGMDFWSSCEWVFGCVKEGLRFFLTRRWQSLMVDTVLFLCKQEVVEFGSLPKWNWTSYNPLTTRSMLMLISLLDVTSAQLFFLNSTIRSDRFKLLKVKCLACHLDLKLWFPKWGAGITQVVFFCSLCIFYPCVWGFFFFFFFGFSSFLQQSRKHSDCGLGELSLCVIDWWTVKSMHWPCPVTAGIGSNSPSDSEENRAVEAESGKSLSSGSALTHISCSPS